MTAEQKSGAARFLDLAAASLAGGYRIAGTGELSFESDPLPAVPAAGAKTESGASVITDSLELIAEEVRACSACDLCRSRTYAAPGEGVPHPLVMVIGEGPGADEDATGRPFVGRAGQLLDRMLDSKGKIGLYRNRNCFIANVVKCRPPGNRDPLPAETEACIPFLKRQIALLSPKVILCVGKVAANNLLGNGVYQTMGSLRGHFFDVEGVPMLPTYHPSALLRNESLKKPAWDDLQLLRDKLRELDTVYAAEIR
jgi:DNA polymerase